MLVLNEGDVEELKQACRHFEGMYAPELPRAHRFRRSSPHRLSFASICC